MDLLNNTDLDNKVKRNEVETIVKGKILSQKINNNSLKQVKWKN